MLGLIGVLVVALAVLGVRAALSDGAPPAAAATATQTTGCAQPTQLRVIVAPEVVDVVQAAGTELAAAGCFRLSVTGASGADALPTVSAGTADLWVPDSSTWVDQLSSKARGEWTAGKSIASSPIGVASNSASPKRPASWRDVIYGSTQFTVADPDTDATSRLAIHTAMSQGPSALTVATGARLIFMSRFASPSTTTLMAAFDKAPGAATGFPASERAVAAHNTQHPDTPIHLRIPTGGTMSLDYRLIHHSDVSDEAVAAVEAALTGDKATVAVGEAGLRLPDGTEPPDVEEGTPAGVRTLAVSPPEKRAEYLAQWDVLRTDMKMLALIDVSGSMTHPSARAGRTRWQVLAGASDRALQILPAGSVVGARIFSSRMAGARDWRELAPMRRLDTSVGTIDQREVLRRALAATKPNPVGDTGLYDSTLAAFRQASSNWSSGYVNSVVVMTDGVNDDPTGGIDLNGLLATLKKEYKKDRPVRIVTIGMGEADTRALQLIAKATGATSYIANTPEDIETVLVKALLARPLPVEQ